VWNCFSCQNRRDKSLPQITPAGWNPAGVGAQEAHPTTDLPIMKSKLPQPIVYRLLGCEGLNAEHDLHEKNSLS
jgi:hypothetical protein